MKITKSYIVDVEFDIADNAPADLFTRGQEKSFQEGFYSHLTSQDDVLQHFARIQFSMYNFYLPYLDGWADVNPHVVSLDVLEVQEF